LQRKAGAAHWDHPDRGRRRIRLAGRLAANYCPQAEPNGRQAGDTRQCSPRHALWGPTPAPGRGYNDCQGMSPRPEIWTHPHRRKKRLGIPLKPGRFSLTRLAGRLRPAGVGRKRSARRNPCWGENTSPKPMTGRPITQARICPHCDAGRRSSDAGEDLRLEVRLLLPRWAERRHSWPQPRVFGQEPRGPRAERLRTRANHSIDSLVSREARRGTLFTGPSARGLCTQGSLADAGHAIAKRGHFARDRRRPSTRPQNRFS